MLSSRRWTVGDAVDLEYFLRGERGEESAAEESHFARSLDPELGSDAASRRGAILAWVNFQRSRRGVATPGQAYDRARTILGSLALLFGAIVGASTVASLLSRKESEPVNALTFFAVTVGPQLVLLIAALSFGLWTKRPSFAPVRNTVRFLLAGLAKRLRGMQGGVGAAMDDGLATLGHGSERLAPLMQCHLLLITQAFAIAFNLAMLVAMLGFHLPFVDLRFGWQSTYPISAAAMHKAVRVVAAPWNWISGGLTPDLTQIETTQSARGQSSQSLPADAAHSWWPFLLCAIAFYGLSLRAAVAGAVWLTLQRRLHRMRLTSPSENALWRRLRGATITSSSDDHVATPAVPERAKQRSAASGLLVVDESVDLVKDDPAGKATRFLQWQTSMTIKASIDDDALTHELILAVAEHESVVIAVRSTRNPIVAISGFLDAVSANKRARAEVTVLLLPEATGETDTVATVQPERVVIWKRFLASARADVSLEHC
jgi:hypothetical protein